jgi:hypothetical protein
MTAEHRAIYLNDHLAGAVAALELLEHLESSYAGSNMAQDFAALRAEIAVDCDELKMLIERLQSTQSAPRKVAAWLASKMAELKMRVDDRATGPLRLLETVEVLRLGIEGKLVLWRGLAAAAELAPALRGMDYERLARRAQQQRDRVEAIRLEAARAALTD